MTILDGVVIGFVALFALFFYRFTDSRFVFDSTYKSETAFEWIKFYVLVLFAAIVSNWVYFYIASRISAILFSWDTLWLISDLALGSTFLLLVMILAFFSLFALVIGVPYFVSKTIAYLLTKDEEKQSIIFGLFFIPVLLVIFLFGGIASIASSISPFAPFFGYCEFYKISEIFQTFAFGTSGPPLSLIGPVFGIGNKCTVLVSATNLAEYPIKISLAYANLTHVYAELGLSPLFSKLAAIFSPIISFVADILGIAVGIKAFNEWRHKRVKK